MDTELNFSDSYIIACGIRRAILTSFGDLMCKGAEWNTNKFVEDIASQESFQAFDIYEMTSDELLAVGFGTLDDTRLKAIPTWLFPFIPEEVNVIKVGETESKKMSKFDFEPETRFGYFNYGILGSDERTASAEQEIAKPE